MIAVMGADESYPGGQHTIHIRKTEKVDDWGGSYLALMVKEIAGSLGTNSRRKHRKQNSREML